MKLVISLIVLMFLLVNTSLAAGLEITEIDVHVDYNEAYTYRVENRARVNSAGVPVANNTKINVDVLPGSNVTFTVRVENTFKGEDPEIKGTVVRITIEDIDDGADLDEDSLDFDLEPGGDYRPEVKFLIPIDVDAGTYNTVIEAEGEDKNGTSYETELNLKLEVKKQSHDIRISKVLLNPSVVDCNRKTKLTAEIVNAGSNAENQIALEFKSANLGINSFDKDIALESSDEASEEEKTHIKTLNFEVPSFFNAGNYPIFVNLYWKNFVLFDQKVADLVVKDCGAPTAAKTPKQGEKKEEVTIIQPKEETKAFEELVTTSQEITIFNSPILLSLSLGAIVVLVLSVLIIFGYLRKYKTS